MPTAHPLAARIFYSVPVQVLDEYVALAEGTDVDQTRNLVKTVMVA